MCFKYKNNLSRGKGFLRSYHFFSGIGLGTVFTLHGTFGAPFRFLPSTVPTSVSGRMTKITMLVTATCVVWTKTLMEINKQVNCQQEGNRTLKDICAVDGWVHNKVTKVDWNSLWLTIHQAPVVQRLDNAIHRINRYPADKCWQNKPRYPLDSDLSGG